MNLKLNKTMLYQEYGLCNLMESGEQTVKIANADSTVGVKIVQTRWTDSFQQSRFTDSRKQSTLILGMAGS